MLSKIGATNHTSLNPGQISKGSNILECDVPDLRSIFGATDLDTYSDINMTVDGNRHQVAGLDL